jgi:hypothetical protein
VDSLTGQPFLLGLAGSGIAAAVLARPPVASARRAAGGIGNEACSRGGQEVTLMSDTPRSILMPDPARDDRATPEDRRDEQVGENRRDQNFQEVSAPQGLKTPPAQEPGEDSGEWTRGGGTDPNELEDTHPPSDKDR